MTLQKTPLYRPRPSFLLAVLAWLACAVPLSAQVSTFYSFAQSSGAWTSITGGTRLNVTNNAFDDQVYTVTIPEFFFDGSYYTTMYVSANGFITFGTAPAGNNYTPLSSNAGYAGAISVFGVNLANATSGTREIRYEQVGNELVVQWRGARRSGMTETIDLQIRLHTVTGAIVFRYNNSTPAGVGAYPQVGLRGPNNTFATNVNNRAVEAASPGPGYTWANSATGTTNGSECRYNNAQAGRSPDNGQTYTWTPVCIPPAAAATVVADCATNTYTIQVDVTNLGSAANVNIQSPVGTNAHTGVGTGSYTIGPIAIGTSRTVRIVHTGSATCNVDLGTFNSTVSCITNGTCLPNPYLSIPDGGCASNNAREAGIAISGFNNTLGTNVDLQSLELIVAHASRGQLQVRLTSPTGQSRNISVSNGGNNDNIGNTGSCPGGAVVFRDDAATAFSAANGNNPTGPYRPDQTLAAFTGDPNGVWTVTICDGTGGTTGTLRYAKLNFCDRPVITATTSNSPSCTADQLSLGVTATGTGLTYAWTGTGTFSPNATSANVTVSGAATGNYSVTVSNGCSNLVENFAVVVNPSPTGVTANSSAASVCSDANTVNLTSVGTIHQTLTSGAGGSTTTAQINNSTLGPNPMQNYYGGVKQQMLWRASELTALGMAAGTVINSVAINLATATGTPNLQNFRIKVQQSSSINALSATPVTANWSTVFGPSTVVPVVGANTFAFSPAVTWDGTSNLLIEFNFSNNNAPTNGYNSATFDTGLSFVATNYYRVDSQNANTLDTYSGTMTYTYQGRNDMQFGVSVINSPVATYAWTSTPSGFTSSQQNPTAVAVTQNTTYTVTVTDPNGCMATANTAVTHVQAPAATIAYTRAAYCVTAGSANVTRTGTSGGTYSSTAGLSINASTGTVTPATSTPGTYTITYTIAAAAPCGQFQTTTQLIIDQIPTTAAAGIDQTTCAVDGIILAANTPVVGIGEWNVVSGPSTNAAQFSAVGSPTSTFLSDGGPGTYTLRWSIDNGSCSPSTDVMVVTVNPCAYYSRATGTLADPIWSLTPSGTAGYAVWNDATGMVVQSGHTVTNTSNEEVGGITVESGANLVLGTYSLTSGGSVTVQGTLTAGDNSTLALVGSGPRTVSLASATSFWDLTFDTPDGATSRVAPAYATRCCWKTASSTAQATPWYSKAMRPAPAVWVPWVPMPATRVTSR